MIAYNKKPKILVQISGGVVTDVKSEIEIDWDYLNWDDVRDGVEIITEEFMDWSKNLLTTDQIRLINDIHFRKKN